MKISKLIVSALLIVLGLTFTSCNKSNKPTKKEEVQMPNHNKMMMHNMKMTTDTRISLNVSPQKAQHQLMNMRNHVIAVQKIIGYLSNDDYDKASEVASKQLGLTDDMKMMCSSFGNADFEKLGMTFHNNADKMSAIFKTKDKNKSLEALALTMNSCVTCHATFKQ
jgi:cytochrome c556